MTHWDLERLLFDDLLWVSNPDGDRGALFEFVILIEDNRSLDDPADAQLHGPILAR